MKQTLLQRIYLKLAVKHINKAILAISIMDFYLKQGDNAKAVEFCSLSVTERKISEKYFEKWQKSYFKTNKEGA